MTEGLFLITTLFVAYVIYVIVNEKKTEAASTKTVAAASSAKPQIVQEDKIEPAKTVEVKVKAATNKTAPKPATAKKAATSSATEAAAPKEEPVSVKGSGLKDPVSGEVVKTYTNYRFTKRWIKEALVAEKLVEKIYKNDELNPEIEDKIKAGIAKLETMKKYKP